MLARRHTHTYVLHVDEKSQNNWQLIIVNYSDCSDRYGNQEKDDKGFLDTVRGTVAYILRGIGLIK